MSFLSWLWNKVLLVYQYFFIKYQGHRFDQDAKCSAQEKTNRQTLFKILKQNKNTKFLIDQRKKSKFNGSANITSIEDFKKLFPRYTTYSDYISYVAEIKENGHTRDIMSVGFPIAFTNTSGTTGEPKNFPVYSFSRNDLYVLSYMLTKAVPSNLFHGGKSISLNSLSYENHVTKDRLKTYKVSAVTTIMAGENHTIENAMKFNQQVVPPIIAAEIKQQKDLFSFILLWTLQCEDLEVIISTFVMGLIHFLTYMEANFDFICKHIELGTIPADESLASPISVDVRLALQSSEYHLPPNPARADELRRIVKDHGFHHVISRFWPKLKCGICVLSPTVKQYELKLRSTYWSPEVPLYPFGYGMSEHVCVAISLKPNSYELIPLPRSTYYEFIEVVDDDEDEDDNDKHPPESFEIHQLERGKRYEVVYTTYDGLYRYKTGDVIRVIGNYYTLPTWQVIGRRGQYLSISTEHVTEIELREIIDSILPKYEQQFTSVSPQYSIFIEKSSYALAIEVDDDKQHDKDRLKHIGQEICRQLDQKLQEWTDEYRVNREEKKKISPPCLFWLKYNTLTTGVREFRLDPTKIGSGKSKIQMTNQLKSQLILKQRSKDVIDFIKQNIVLKVD